MYRVKSRSCLGHSTICQPFFFLCILVLLYETERHCVRLGDFRACKRANRCNVAIALTRAVSSCKQVLALATTFQPRRCKQLQTFLLLCFLLICGNGAFFFLNLHSLCFGLDPPPGEREDHWHCFPRAGAGSIRCDLTASYPRKPPWRRSTPP